MALCCDVEFKNEAELTSESATFSLLVLSKISSQARALFKGPVVPD